MKKIAVVIVLLAICNTTVWAGPGVPNLSLKVQDIEGTKTPSMNALIGEWPNIPYTVLPGLTAGYLYDQDTTNRWTAEYFANPYPATGQFQWLGHMETGSSDLRTTHTFEWLRNNGSNTDQTYEWFLIGYSVDNRHRICYLNIKPTDVGYGTFTVPVSKGGYDFVVAASPVPEPSAFLALTAGIIGTAGAFIRRRKR